ncbi:BREX-1 system adenine-specific DNA-methyltransferase PglX [Pseudomonas sp. WHRI 8822A]|uniref:BREX-1 system adenine-specific DNA-methyltransferase PglX n=1 Tax=Pseudomonas sp. WHRI 8822A TaxID=3162568 RepID=UPI0032ED7F20
MSGIHKNSPEQGVETYFFRASAVDFKKIQGGPIAYWMSDAQIKLFTRPKISQYGRAGVGLQTGNNGKFIRYWFEIDRLKTSLEAEGQDATRTWYLCNKGGDYRKWFGNGLEVVLWKENGAALKANVPSAVIRNESLYFLPCVTWSRITTGNVSFRYLPEGFVHNDASCFIVGDSPSINLNLLAYLNSPLRSVVVESINPTLNLLPGQINETPYLGAEVSGVESLINSARKDWDSSEISWGFTKAPLLDPDHHQPTLNASYQKLRAYWREMTLEMQSVEERNNRIFIDAYGLQDELDEKVDLSEITLTCNPYYRYGSNKSEEELEAMLLADTMRELISYAVGCMFGRYSLDKPGLILANQGETLADYLAQVPQPSFPADDDNVIPLLDGDWFPDDITLRFRQFLRVAFGDAHYEDNLAFIEQGLNVKGKRNYGLREYFLSEFYADHVKRYKKRPIYWLFSSPKGTFSALAYLHRYRPDTVSVVLSYLRDFRKKLASRLDYLQQVAINPSASQSEKTKASKEADTIKKQLIELDDYERDTLYPLATEQVELDLDDGVKANYLKLGAALKKIPGLEAKED